MKKLLIFLVVLPCFFTAALGFAGDYSFPAEGVGFLGEVMLLVTPDTVMSQESSLITLGVNVEELLGDFLANQTLFAVFLENGACVALSRTITAETQLWGSVSRMSEQDKDAFLSAFSQPPFDEGAEWVEASFPAVKCGYTMEADGVPMLSSMLVTVERGTLFRLTATGKNLSAETLHTANLDVSQMTTFLPFDEAEILRDRVPVIPDMIPDDGLTTPLSLHDFSGVTTSDLTHIFIQTLPAAELLLRTANDTLRGRADAEGGHMFAVSTLREIEYSYTILATAEGRTQSAIDFTIERRIDDENYEAAYRRRAFQIDRIGYANIKNAQVGTTIQLRGKVGDFSSLSGYPCVLIFTQNPRLGVWEAPLWIQLVVPFEPLEMD
ncbi:MAG: hypothetical protein FWG37_06515, partial [Clostridia bacterium]|nr:hypothetical protein [Clostridia bacterium]